MTRIFFVAGLLSLLALQSCTTATAEKQQPQEALTFIATSPVTIDTAFSKEYVAQIRSFRNIEVRAQEKGFLQKIYVDEGQYVKAGQLLFKIMPNLYEAELQKALAELKATEIELQNAAALAEKNIVSQNEKALAEAKVEQAKAAVAMARLHLSFTDVKAPFDGFIDRLPKKIGSLLDEGELLTSLSDNSKMFAYFNVSEPEYLEYQVNAKGRGDNLVSLMLANNQPMKQKGKIEVIESEFNNETGNIAFRAVFPNPDNLLRNGETGKVMMTVPLKKALVIPQKATYEIQNKVFVFVIDANNTVQSREISITGELPDLYVVASGIAPGEKILLEGVQKVKDGEQVRCEYQDPHEVLAHLRLKAE